MVEPLAVVDDPVERGGIGIAACNHARCAADPLGPFERPDRVFDREHRGGVDRLAPEHAFVERTLACQAEDLGQRPGRRVAFEPLDRARAKDQDAMRAFAAEHFLPAEGRDVDLVPWQVIGEHRARRVGKAQSRAVFGDPVAIGHAHAARRAVPGEQYVIRPVDCRQIGQIAIIGTDHCGIDPELLHRVGHPAFAEAFPGEHGDGARAEHRPHRHFECAGIAAGDDADAVCIGQAQQFAHQVDASGKARLADGRAVRSSKAVGGEFPGGPARRLGARTGGKIGTRRTARGYYVHIVSPYRERAPRWDGVARSPA